MADGNSKNLTISLLLCPAIAAVLVHSRSFFATIGRPARLQGCNCDYENRSHLRGKSGTGTRHVQRAVLGCSKLSLPFSVSSTCCVRQCLCAVFHADIAPWGRAILTSSKTFGGNAVMDFYIKGEQATRGELVSAAPAANCSAFPRCAARSKCSHTQLMQRAVAAHETQHVQHQLGNSSNVHAIESTPIRVSPAGPAQHRIPHHVRSARDR